MVPLHVPAFDETDELARGVQRICGVMRSRLRNAEQQEGPIPDEFVDDATMRNGGPHHATAERR